MTQSLELGWRGGLISALGIETGTLIHVAGTAAGLSAAIASSAILFEVLKYLGAIVLIYLGVRAVMNRADGHLSDQRAEPDSKCDFARAVVVDATNPKIALFFVAFFPRFVDPHRGSPAFQIVVLGLLLCLVGLSIICAYAVLEGSPKPWPRRRPAVVAKQPLGAGAIYRLLGIATIVFGHDRADS